MIFKPFMKLFAGAVLVQLITFLFYPILGRKFDPSDFGAYGVVSSLGVLLSLVVNGQLQTGPCWVVCQLFLKGFPCLKLLLGILELGRFKSCTNCGN
jgi:hypothetical protein